MVEPAPPEAPCCGSPPEPPSDPHEKAGYQISPYIDGFHEVELRSIPRIKTRLQPADWLGMVKVRLGIARNSYKVAPGLYCSGNPDYNSPVLVTANYKFSFDCLRKNLVELDSWIIVLDTRGVNVWCAAGKKTFSTSELIRQVKETGIKDLVVHNELILPQLAAPGVSALFVKKHTGFKVVYGPVQATDLKQFLSDNKKATPEMRQITFSLGERLVLIPLEIVFMLRSSFIALLALFFISGICANFFSLEQAWLRWPLISSAYGAGFLSGTVLVPLLLPWIPGRSFYLKGILMGIPATALILFFLGDKISILEIVALGLGALSISSYTAMNFTGATPFTSPSGVEKEMRRGIPLQIIALVISLVAWASAPFIN